MIAGGIVTEKQPVTVGRGGGGSYPISASSSFVRHQLLLKSSFHFTDQKNDRGKGGKGKGICVCVCVVVWVLWWFENDVLESV